MSRNTSQNMMRVARRVAIGVVLLSITGAVPTAAGPIRTVRAADLVASVAVQVHLKYNEMWGLPHSPYADHARVERALDYINPRGAGVHVVRDTVFYANSGRYLDEMRRLGRRGYRWDIYIGYDDQHPDWSEQFDIIGGLISAGHVALVEGGLEVDNPGWGLVAQGITYRALNGTKYTGWAAAIAGQRDLYERFRGRVPVALWSLAEPGNGVADGPASVAARQMGTSVAALSDWGNVHFYQPGGKSPSHPDGGELLQTIAAETGTTPGKPFAITETGFNDLNQRSTNYLGTPEVNAQYTLALLLEAYMAGSALTVLYQLFDEGTGTTGDIAFEAHWGLFAFDGTPKPAATALRNLMLVAGDGAAEARRFALAPVDTTVQGLPRGGNALNLQKSDGTDLVVVWPGANLYPNGKRVTPPVSTVRVRLAGERDVAIYDPAQGPAPVKTVHGARTVELSLSDRLLVVAVAPPGGTAESRRPR